MIDGLDWPHPDAKQLAASIGAERNHAPTVFEHRDEGWIGLAVDGDA